MYLGSTPHGLAHIMAKDYPRAVREDFKREEMDLDSYHCQSKIVRSTTLRWVHLCLDFIGRGSDLLLPEV